MFKAISRHKIVVGCLMCFSAIALSIVVVMPHMQYLTEYTVNTASKSQIINTQYLSFESRKDKENNKNNLNKLVDLSTKAINEAGEQSKKTLKELQDHIVDFKFNYTVYNKGQVLVKKGERITQTQKEALQFYSNYKSGAWLMKYIGVLMFIGLVLGIHRGIMAKFIPKQHKKNNRYILCFSISILVFFTVWILQHLSQQVSIFNPLFLIPFPFAAIILTLLVHALFAFVCIIAMAMIVGIMIQVPASFLAIMVSVAIFSVAITHRKNKRSEVMTVGYLTTIFLAVVIVAYGLFNLESYYLWYLGNMVFAAINGVGSAMISLALLPYFESMFSISTNQTLLELADLNHPLLKRMMINAPGTYQHSIMVANLAETAAEEINANPVLCRTGGYFHDIGKIKRPLFYGENQKGENPHQELTPRMSKTIIAAHTKEGVELAKKYKLPNIIIEFIEEHHGTSLVSFFYIQAKQQDQRSNPQDDFRYPGPKPHFKESGVLMLADAVEASVRALDKPSVSKIENLITEVFNDKIKDGQLDHCPLTLKEIATIKNSFLQVLRGIHHRRLNYKSEIKNLLKEENKKMENDI